MLSKDEILKMADIRLDLSLLSPKQIENLENILGGTYNEVHENHLKYIERGIDMFLSIGEPVEISIEGKTQITKVKAVDYDRKDEYFKIICENGTYYRFRTAGFNSFGRIGAFYGLVNDPDKKTGLRYLNFNKLD